MKRLSYFEMRKLARVVARNQAKHVPTNQPKGGRDYLQPYREVAQYESKKIGIDWNLVISNRRQAEVVKKRHFLMNLMADRYTELSLPDLGVIFNRDHTSILHALRKQAA